MLSEELEWPLSLLLLHGRPLPPTPSPHYDELSDDELEQPLSLSLQELRRLERLRSLPDEWPLCLCLDPLSFLPCFAFLSFFSFLLLWPELWPAASSMPALNALLTRSSLPESFSRNRMDFSSSWEKITAAYVQTLQ